LQKSIEKKIVVVYLSQYGCWAYTKEILKQLNGFDPIIICSQHHSSDFHNKTVKTLETKDSKTSIALASLTVKKKIKELLLQLIAEQRRLHLYFPAFHPWNVIFMELANSYDIASTVTIHDYVTHPGEKSLLTECFQKKCIKQADSVIFLSEYVKNQAALELGDQEKFKVIAHPLLPVSNLNQIEHGSELKLLFLGRILKYKGVQLLIDSIKEMDNIKLTIAGVQQAPLQVDKSRTTVINQNLTESEITKLLVSHHVLVLPYLSASQSGVLTLGVSAEIPMIITKVGGLYEQLGPLGALWVEPSSKGLRQAIIMLRDNPSLYLEIKDALRSSKQRMKKSNKLALQSLVL